MLQLQDQAKEDCLAVEYNEDNGQLESFYNKLKEISCISSSFKQQNYKLATYNEIMLFMVKVYVLLAGMLTALYLLTSIFYIVNKQNQKDMKNFDFPLVLYLIITVCTIVVGFLAYFLESSRRFPLNLIYYISFTGGAAYMFGYPLSILLLQGYKVEEDWVIILYLFTMTLGTYASLILFLFRRQTPFNSSAIILTIFGVMIFLVFIYIMTEKQFIGILVGSFACHVMYGVLLIIDTKLIIQGKFSLTTNQCISGALYLYLDISIMIFVFIGCIIYAAGYVLGIFVICCGTIVGGLKK